MILIDEPSIGLLAGRRSMSSRGWWLLASVACVAIGSSGCSVVLDADPVQCEFNEDCEFLGELYQCRKSACVSSEPEAASCPEVAAYVWSDTLAPVRNACSLPVEQTATLLTAGENEVEVSVPFMPMPFDFCLYGRIADTLWVGDNGYLAVSDQPPAATQSSVGGAHSLGQPGVPGPGVAAFWEALQVSAAGVCAAVEGTEPNRTLWVTWEGVCFEDGTGNCDASSGSSLTFSAGLEEATGSVIVGYFEMVGEAGLSERASGQLATIGVTNDGPRGCAATECDASGTCSDGVTPCGYTQFSAQTVPPGGLRAIEFSPVE